MYDLEKGKAKAKATAAAAEAAAAAAETVAAKAEAEARLRVAQARLDAEEKFLSLSERNSCVTGGSRRSSKSYYNSRTGVTFGCEKFHRGILPVASDRKPGGNGDLLNLNALLNKLPPMAVCDEKNLVNETKKKLPVQNRLGLDSPLLFRDDGGPINPQPGSCDSHARHKYRSSNIGFLDLRSNNRREGALPVRACEQAHRTLPLLIKSLCLTLT